jgi:hypothetical protein
VNHANVQITCIKKVRISQARNPATDLGPNNVATLRMGKLSTVLLGYFDWVAKSLALIAQCARRSTTGIYGWDILFEL